MPLLAAAVKPNVSAAAVTALSFHCRADPVDTGMALNQQLLWHFSENPEISEFRPQVAKTADISTPLVWAVQDAHQCDFWFPRECPRMLFWPKGEQIGTAPKAVLSGATRVHAIEWAWLERVRTAVVYRYGFDPAAFRPHEDPPWYWLADRTIRPMVIEPVTDLLKRHDDAGIELRVVRNLWPLVDLVVDSGCGFSGIRLRNAMGRP